MALPKDSGTLIDAILAKRWEELEAVELDSGLLFPAEVVRRKGKGWERIPVLLKVPREPDTRRARLKARAWAAEEGLDPEVDSMLFDNMDTMCILSECIRNTTAPYEAWEPFPTELEAKYDRPSLDAVWATIDALKTIIDPRPDALSEEQLVAVIGTIARCRNIVPLAAFGGEFQTNFVVTMAVRLQAYLDSKSSSAPSVP